MTDMVPDGSRLRSQSVQGRASTIFLGLALFASLSLCSRSNALEVPALKGPVSDFAHMIPPASFTELEDRLKVFKAQTGSTVAVVTIATIADENIEDVGRQVFRSLPLSDKNRRQTVLLVVARKEQIIDVQTGSELRPLFPHSPAVEKLQAQVEPYFNGWRPDLGIHAGVHFIFGVIRGDFRVDRTTEEEALENTSKGGAGASAIFAVCLSPFLAFFVGMLWGIYGTHFGVRREMRLFMGAILGGGTARIVATLMEMMGRYSDSLWYFILALSIVGGVFGSLTEFWMAGEWSGIPRVKDKVKRKPEDNIGI
jgi:uncharacterized membrane protein YgcG